MPPKKTDKKAAAKKAPAKKNVSRRPTAKKPAKRNYRRKKPDRKLPITALIAVVPAILLGVFIILRFSGGEPTAPQAEKHSEKPQIIVKEKEVRSVGDTVKLFMFERGLPSKNLQESEGVIKIKADSEKSAENLTAELKDYLKKGKITVDGNVILTAEDKDGIYNISFTYPPAKKPSSTPVKKTAVKKNYKAKLAVVIDDCGYSLPLAKELAAVRYPVTFAVLPFTPYGKETARIARKSGKTLFLHFPMQPKSYPKFDPGKGALFLNMPESLISAVTKANFEYFPMKLDGANNHTGSAYTENREKMTQALREIKRYVPAFLDSYTSGSSVAYAACLKEGMKCGVNNVFLDNEEPGLVTVRDKQNHVHQQLILAAKRALRRGHAVAIGHLKRATVSSLNSSFAAIEDMGVKIVSVTELMD